jgi:thiol-disulfide isomerase/thioredoxin
MKFKLMLIFILLVTGCTQAANNGSQATAFSLPQLGTNLQLQLADYKGKVVYLDFWASWCKPCIASFPKLNALHEKYAEQGFTVIAVNLDQKQSQAQAFLKSHPVSYPVVFDSGAQVAGLYSVNAMPTSFFIDKKGVIRLSHQGFNPGDEIKIEKAIKLLLAE